MQFSQTDRIKHYPICCIVSLFTFTNIFIICCIKKLSQNHNHPDLTLLLPIPLLCHQDPYNLATLTPRLLQKNKNQQELISYGVNEGAVH